ncbi:MAG: acetylxylan esterase [Verrucomicrobiae bacterium]|nr:acetylxylan esterase [Verrucomicrobiae bacterium]
MNPSSSSSSTFHSPFPAGRLLHARRRRRAGAAVLFSSLLFAAAAGLGQNAAPPPRVLPEGKLPNDQRLAAPVTLHDYHPFRPVASAAAWEARRAQIKLRVKVACGLFPEPAKTPLNAVIHGKVDLGDYTVERVFFESMPGHYVCGSLYRPAGESLARGEKDGKRPGVLCPHGHWANGRFYDAGDAQALQQIAMGAERFESAAHNPIQARCVQLARMGCVVFQYDMLGYADSVQFPEHRRGPRESMNSPETGKWGFVSPAATSRLQTNFGLQTWNSVRSLDFILGLDGVDPARVLVTGASGGGTQTQMISAIDERVTASFPCVMPSTSMQGGCTCENTNLLRIGQGNIDIAAAVAPRPLGMTSADDWTLELKTKGYPELLALYELAGAKGKYEAFFDIHFKHNYNHVSRTHMYAFANKHFGLGFKEPVLERDFERLERDRLTVWGGEHPAPSGERAGDAHERAVNRWWAEDSDRQIAPLLAPKDADTLAQSRSVLGQAASILIGRELPAKEDVNFGLVGKEKLPGQIRMTGMIGNDKHGEEIPAAFVHPENWNGRVALWISPRGKAGLFDGGGGLDPAVGKLVEAGYAVAGLDLFKQGEFLNPGESADENPRITYSNKGDELPADSWQRSPVYYYGYNDSIFARRVHDILTAVTFVRNHESWDVKEVVAVGLRGAGPWVAAARAIAGGGIDRAVVETEGFRFARLPSDWAADFLPGAVKYGDVAGFLTLGAPHPLLLADSDATLRGQLGATYATAGAKDAVAFTDANGAAEAMMRFLEK